MNILINGFGRIGRLVYRQLHGIKDLNVVAVNDLTTPYTLAYLLEHDSAQGLFKPGKVCSNKDEIIVDDKKIKVFSERNPEDLPLKKLKVDLVIESTGFFRTRELAEKHIKAGAKKVLISAPAKGDLKTIVYGVNHEILDKNDVVVSGASCTTNCLAPIVKVLNEKFGIVSGLMTTIHSVTNDQRVLDLPHSDLRRGRSSLNNIIPTSTGAAAAIGLVMPELKGKLDGFALRVPTVTGSVVDLTVELRKEEVTACEVNAAMKEASSESFGYTEKEIVSTDIIGSTFASVFDPYMTKLLVVDGHALLKVGGWYDNENSYVSNLIRTAKHMLSL